MSRRKPWDTSGPPQPRSKREKGRDQLFKEKKTGVPERDKPPKPGGLTGHDWQEVLTPISAAFSDIQVSTYRAAKHIEKTQSAWAEALGKLVDRQREREEKSAVRGVIEDNALAREEPYHILGEVIRESPEKR